MTTRNGKIANLPSDIREQLNLRLLEGESGKELAAWLNGLPDAQSVIGLRFNGSPISEVNLTYWRQGGYLQWLTERECFDSACALAEGDSDLAETGLCAERLLNVLTVRYGQLLMRWDSSPDENSSEPVAFAELARKARILQGISRSVLAIHRIQSQKLREAGVPAGQKRHGADSLDRQAGKDAPPEAARDFTGDHEGAPSPAPFPMAAFCGSSASDVPPSSLAGADREAEQDVAAHRPLRQAQDFQQARDLSGRPIGRSSTLAETASSARRTEPAGDASLGAEKLALQFPPRAAAEIRAEAVASAASDPSHESPRLSSSRQAPSPDVEPGLAAAALGLFRARGRAGANPKALSGPIAPSILHSKLSHTPFNTEPDLAEVLNAV